MTAFRLWLRVLIVVFLLISFVIVGEGKARRVDVAIPSFGDRETCISCGVCVESCPNDVIRLEPSSKKAYVANGDDCCTCFLCEMDCPVRAIEVIPDFTRRRPFPY